MPIIILENGTRDYCPGGMSRCAGRGQICQPCEFFLETNHNVFSFPADKIHMENKTNENKKDLLRTGK